MGKKWAKLFPCKTGIGITAAAAVPGLQRGVMGLPRQTNSVFFFFFEGLYFLRKLYLKNLNIKNKNNKISQGEIL